MTKSKLLLILYAFFNAFKIKVVGQLMVGEIIALSTVPFYSINNLVKKYKHLSFVLICLLALLLVQMISDFYNDTAIKNFARGWAGIVFCVISVLFLVKNLSYSENNLIYFLLASIIGRFIFGSNELDFDIFMDDSNYFKKNIVIFSNFTVMLVSSFFYSRLYKNTSLFLLISYGLLCLVLDARSDGIIFIFSGFLIYGKGYLVRQSKVTKTLFFLLLMFILYIVYFLYVGYVLTGKIDGANSTSQLTRALNPYNPFELFLFGRSETFTLIYAGLEKPFFGHGSWAPDVDGKYAMIAATLSNRDTIWDTGSIPAHSILFGYFAYAGSFALFILLVLFLRLLKIFYGLLNSSVFMTNFPIIVVLSVEMIWDFIFSPIGHLRTTFPLSVSLLIVSYHRYISFKPSQRG